jgi:hypothetical protein
LGDAINHIARMHVLVAGDGSPLRRFYTVHWPLSPYLAMDAVVPLLAHIMPLMAAAKIFIGACLLMPPAAVATLQWACRGRIGLVPAAAFLLSQNMLLAFGFLNFLFMSGLSVMLFAAWISTTHWPRWRRAAVFAPAVLVLYLGHIFACIGYCLAVAGFEIARAARCRFRPLSEPDRKCARPSRLACVFEHRSGAASCGREHRSAENVRQTAGIGAFSGRLSGVALDWLAAGAQAVPALLLTPFFDRGQVAIGEAVTHYGTIAVRLTSLASPFLFFSDAVSACVVLAIFAGVLLMAWRMRIAASVWPAALLLGVASLAMPHVLAGVWGTDLRLPLIACMLGLGGLSLRLPPRAGALVLAGITLLTLMKSLDGTAILQRLDGRITQTRRVLAALPRGSRLLVMDETGLTEPGVSPNALWHIPLMAVIDRDAFVPYLFTGFMTVHPTDAVRDASTPSGRPLDPAELADGLTHPNTPGATIPDGRGGRIYWYGWRQNFDFLLVQHAGHRSPLPDFLQPVACSEVADLYKITPAASR